MVKQRKESAETYKQGNRDDLQKKELEEIKIIEEFLPKQLLEDEVIQIIEDLISQNNISDIRGMGKIMSELKKNTPTMTKDKIAVMSALNIVSSYLKQEDELNEYSDVSDEINNLQKSLQDFGIE